MQQDNVRICVICSAVKTWVQLRDGKLREHWYKYQNGYICLSCYKKVSGQNKKQYTSNKYKSARTIQCKCGCKREIKQYDIHGRIHFYINGHQPKNTSKLIPFMKGEKHLLWKGGKNKHTEGYIEIHHPEDTSRSRNRILEHRLIMEKYLGRKLEKHELIHHINGIKTDNRIENLQLTTRREHPSYHKTKS